MRFKVDENLPADAVTILRDAGHDAMSVGQQSLSGSDDETLADVCREEGRCIVTLDVGFSDIRTYPPGPEWSAIVLRPSTEDRTRILDLIARIATLLETETVEESLWIVDDSRVRIRRTDS